MEDDNIIALYFDRDQNAIAETKKKYGGYCFSLADRILENKEDSEECVNDILYSAWNSIPPQRPKYFRMFLAKLTRNRALNRIKADNAQKRGGDEISLIYEELSEFISDGRDTESEIIAKELGQAINSFVKELSEREGDIFIRRYFFIEAVKDIAEGYGLTLANVSMILGRTRKKLKEYLENNGYM
jgi:RNA polymerase sigma-70 factor (ECF subfamily)